MFTGLVEELGKVRAVSRGVHSIRLTITAQKIMSDVKIGDSIAVDGTCLTVVEFGANSFTADIMPETYDRTTLSSRKPGELVNLERTLRLGDRLGGHIVSGHIDGVGTIVSITPRDNANVLRVRFQTNLSSFFISQGSVALDGVSLTIVDCGLDWLEVSLIPHTWGVTVLSTKKVGDQVNIETDVLGKYIQRMLLNKGQVQNNNKNTVGTEFLAKHGFFD
jgi:riboflavin synthase